MNYSNSYVKWGESAHSGAWAGAGTNGGINLAVIDASCPLLPGYYMQQLGPAFAGLHLFATLEIVNGDTGNVSDRGSAFAARWAVNHSGVVAQAWLEALHDVSGGLACADGEGGGGHGINGCGTYNVTAMDSTATAAHWKIFSESWVDLRDDTNDGAGNSAFSSHGLCNYDCEAWPIILN